MFGFGEGEIPVEFVKQFNQFGLILEKITYGKNLKKGDVKFLTNIIEAREKLIKERRGKISPRLAEFHKHLLDVLRHDPDNWEAILQTRYKKISYDRLMRYFFNISLTPDQRKQIKKAIPTTFEGIRGIMMHDQTREKVLEELRGLMNEFEEEYDKLPKKFKGNRFIKLLRVNLYGCVVHEVSLKEKSIVAAKMFGILLVTSTLMFGGYHGVLAISPVLQPVAHFVAMAIGLLLGTFLIYSANLT